MKIKLSSSAAYGLALFGVFLVALFMRVYFQYDRVFAGGWVRFYENDPWYHMRQIENLSHHFPHLNTYDPYIMYPGGWSVSTGPFLDYLIGFLAWVIGLGSPSQNVIETVGAWVPAIMGALITVPVYVIGRELFNRKAGILAAALIAILPGQFLWRTMLGFTDHHVAELFFSALTMMFLILAMKKAREKMVSFTKLRNGEWESLNKPLLYSLLAGLFLGLYLLSWRSGVFLIFIIFTFVTIQFIIDHLKGRPTDYLGIVFIPSFILALVMVVPASGRYGNMQVASLGVSIVAFVIFSLLSNGMTNRNINRYYYPLLLAIAGGIGIALFRLVDPSLLNSMLHKFKGFTPDNTMRTISETRGISFSQIWAWFSTDLYIALISLGIVGYMALKEDAPEKTLLFVWSAIVLVAAFTQNRNAYYLAVNVAILAAYLSWKILELPSFIKRFKKVPVNSPKKEKLTKKKRRREEIEIKQKQVTWATKHNVSRYAYTVVAIVAIFFLAFFPNIGHAINQAKITVGPNDDWHESLVWMRNNTPDPFGNPDSFYSQYKKPAAGKPYIYPESAYGVMSLWQYGYWITYIAHRIPNGTAGQLNAQITGSFFAAQSESEATGILDQMGSKYVIIDYSMATTKFYAMPIWAGKKSSEFMDIYRLRNAQGELKPIMLYYPEYYLSMSSRLYNFGGKAWNPDDLIKIKPEYKIRVISYTQGIKYRDITDIKQFNSYGEAKSFLNANPGYRIVGDNPLVSPVPLGELKHFGLVHMSPTKAVSPMGETISNVEIFQYTP